jgi:hypothetical protein
VDGVLSSISIPAAFWLWPAWLPKLGFGGMLNRTCAGDERDCCLVARANGGLVMAES